MPSLPGRMLRLPVVVLRWIGVVVGVLVWLVVVPLAELVRGVTGRVRRSRMPASDGVTADTGVVPLASRDGKAVEPGVRARRRASAEP